MLLDKNTKYKHIKVSNVDPDSGYYHKGEHEKVFAYTASAFCDKNGYVLQKLYQTAGLNTERATKRFVFFKTGLAFLQTVW